MKKINLLFLMSLIFGAALLNSCSDDETTPDAPSVTAPSSTEEVVASESVDVTFTVSVPGGFASASTSAVGGSATVKSSPSAGTTSGDVVVSFTAGSSAGVGSVTLTVTDANQKMDNGTAVLSVVEEETTINVSSNISADVTWEKGKVYVLKSRISVLSGVTLTIEPGVIVKGEAGADANATALIITRGAKIMAEGTAGEPIIFTSVADNIMPGEIVSPNLEPTLNGLWGGLIVLGKAHVSLKSNELAGQIEGIPSDDTNGLYGGEDDADNSGVLKYISIRHGGTNIGEGNEINGLTLGGVGSATTIENIEVVANQDDGIEFFGGKPALKNVLIWNNGDDGLDTDQAFAGSVDNFMVINPGDKGFELDGPEGSYEGTGHTLMNGTVIMGSCGGGYDDDDNTDGIVKNVYFTGFTADSGKENDYNENGSFICSNLQMDGSYVDGDGNTVTITVAEYFADMAEKVDGEGNPVMSIVETPTVGATTSEFTWTWAAAASAF
nr:hypothetical protein [uncultured Draconibacterium sp.]